MVMGTAVNPPQPLYQPPCHRQTPVRPTRQTTQSRNHPTWQIIVENNSPNFPQAEVYISFARLNSSSLML